MTGPALVRKVKPTDSLHTIEEFKKMVVAGVLTNYDGHGMHATADRISDAYVSLEDIRKGTGLAEQFKHILTHVVWFNK